MKMYNLLEIPKPLRLSDKEFIAIFPEAGEIIAQKLHELRKQRKAIVAIIDGKLVVINDYPDEMSRWFWRQWLKLNEGEDLLTTDRHIARLERQLRIAKGLPTPKGALTDDAIQAARDVPVEDLFNQPFKRAGRTLVGLCPFHEDRTPSFHIYPDQNRGWCYGCNQGGDAIGLTMMLHDYGFKEAVQLLTGGQS
jgi:hypothetical protein